MNLLIYFSLGANLVQSLVEQIEGEFNDSMLKAREENVRLNDEESEAVDIGKECVNMTAFLSELYNFHVITCQLIYDVMQLCTSEINEFTAELMLKIIQISGIELRKDDPLALKDVIIKVNKTVDEKQGGVTSVRCKFMIETLSNLKNNRMKRTMNVSADNVSRLSKFIGNLSKKRDGN